VPTDAAAGQLGETFWRELDTGLRPRLVSFVSSLLWSALKRGENPGFAEDIVNEALAAAYSRRGTFDPRRGSPEGWLIEISRNKAYDFLRKHRELKCEQSLDESHPSLPELPDDTARPGPRTLALRRALKRLSRYDQELLLCRFGNALDYAEMERYFRFTVKRATLRVHVARAQARLRRLVAKHTGFTEWPRGVSSRKPSSSSARR
jgi:RNA polymerase sigma factor (sigma-70 family)